MIAGKDTRGEDVLVHYNPSLTTMICTYRSLAILHLTSFLHTMETINIRENNLTSLPNFASLTKLKNLNVSENELTSLSDMPVNIQGLRAARNKITSVTNGSTKWLSSVTDLRLSYNKIDDMSFTSYTDKLSFLDVSFNLITKVPISSISIERLDVECNKITTIPFLLYTKENFLCRENPFSRTTQMIPSGIYFLSLKDQCLLYLRKLLALSYDICSLCKRGTVNKSVCEVIKKGIHITIPFCTDRCLMEFLRMKT